MDQRDAGCYILHYLALSITARAVSILRMAAIPEIHKWRDPRILYLRNAIIRTLLLTYPRLITRTSPGSKSAQREQQGSSFGSTGRFAVFQALEAEFSEMLNRRNLPPRAGV